MARSLQLWTALLTLAVLTAAACTSGDGGTATPSATASAEPTTAFATASPTRTPTPTPTATGEPTRVPDPPRTVWLIDGATGEVLTLHQDASYADARFNAAGTRVELRTAEEWLAFALDGSPAPAPERRECLPAGEDAVVGGVTFEETRCGSVSPDGRWMLFPVPLENTNGDRDQWVLDLETGERRLLEPGLRSCGGCDGRFGPGYSPDEGHVYFAETVGNGRTFVSDLLSGETDLLGDGGTEINRRPLWAPNGERLLYSDDGERLLIRDFESGDTSEVQALDWPASFDALGTSIFSSPYSAADAAPTTTVVDATTFEVLASVDGAAGVSAFWYPRVVVARSGDGIVVAVEQAASCVEGITIYTPASPDGACFESAVGATVSPDGRLVAFSVQSGDTASHSAPSDFRVVLVDTESLETLATIEGAQSYDAPPVLKWNPGSTHLLVTWPHALGL